MISTRDKIIRYAKSNQEFRTPELVPRLKISRQNIVSHLRKLVAEGILTKTGSTHNSCYRLASQKTIGKSKVSETKQQLSLIKKLDGLQEDLVFEEVKKRLPLSQSLSKNVQSIAYYSFSEILNNAIDHSKAMSAKIEVELENGYFHFTIRDQGIGVFENVKTYFKLENQYEAAEHLLKGKQTTFPERHSGQGIFFTSRIADRFVLSSHRLRITVDNAVDDAHFSDIPFVKGTRVDFRIKQRSRKVLQSMFDKFSREDQDFEFNQNEVRLRLRADRELISRSQARRLLAGMEDYKYLVFDFKDIQGIGQAFADEVFRVYTHMNPSKKVEFINAGPIVEYMIKRAREP